MAILLHNLATIAAQDVVVQQWRYLQSLQAVPSYAPDTTNSPVDSIPSCISNALTSGYREHTLAYRYRPSVDV
ncbi:hypothetical protein HNQ59_003144 [Chitinivorax tropicus]|uniref:Uncharacterized protein n=1 Tax=Chitinivorax tropicus TaxID=714531 RepID=A0A840MTZ2_9PROT|nr:hypothetical protein [Chitinivorax tropicus]